MQMVGALLYANLSSQNECLC